MKKPKIVFSVAGVLLLLVGALIFDLVIVRASTKTKIVTSTDTSYHIATMQVVYMRSPSGKTTATRRTVQMKVVVAPQPTMTSSQQPTAVLPPRSAPSPIATQPTAIPVQYNPGSDYYYPLGTPVNTMKADATNLTKLQVKTLIESQVNKNLAVIQSTLGFSTEAQAYAFFLGLATRESTLDAGLETGSGSGHSYGPIQASEDAYANSGYPPESDVPQMVAYDFTPQNYYDPGIAVHMGIRHLLHYAHQASNDGYAGLQLLRHALIGYNTGSVTDSDPSWLQQYSDEIGAIAGWYLNNGHLYDSQFTWTGSSVVVRSNPWGWY